MKYYSKFLLSALIPVAALTSCADYNVTDFEVEKPASVADNKDLQNYSSLKSYINRASYPDFKLGAAVNVSAFMKQEQVYVTAVSNFDEVVAGNAMKYSSCVNDMGVMDFSKVTEFVQLANKAGLNVYGHTLCWHSQQRPTYLNGLLADRPGDTSGAVATNNYILKTDFSDGMAFGGWGNGSKREVVDEVLVLTNPSAANPWSAQVAIDGSFKADEVYYMSMKIKGSAEGSIGAGLQNSKTYAGCGDFPSIGFTTDWNTVVLQVTCTSDDANRLTINFGAFVGSIYIDDFALYTESESTMQEVKNYLTKTDFSDGQALGGWGNGSKREVVDGAMAMTNPSAANPWSAQAAVDGTFKAGEDYYMSMKVKGSAEGKFGAGLQNSNTYAGCGDFPSIGFTTDWKEIEVKVTCSSDDANRLTINYGDFVGTIYIDDFALYTKSMQSVNPNIPLTAEEKRDTLLWALDQWISGMMEATEGKVLAWDAVNEALSGSDKDGDGKYDLQSVVKGNVSEESAASGFYWQDYLGDNYVRDVIRIARERGKEYGAENLKLFINDYNLESTWDDNGKMKSLLKWIEQWEADGVTKIDGIGSQMHISYNMKPAAQKSQEEHVVKMLELMASSGKLCRISELDMGIIDENGEKILTDDVTEEQHKAMAEFYKFIVKKYFEIIPVAQQYGICQWCMTDAANDSGWRGGEPVGLWTADFQRKFTFAGFAEGLEDGTK